jgi:hypothetical protein
LRNACSLGFIIIVIVAILEHLYKNVNVCLDGRGNDSSL